MSIESEDHVLPIQLQELYNPPLDISHSFGRINSYSYSDTPTQGIWNVILYIEFTDMIIGGYVFISNPAGLSTGYLGFYVGGSYCELPDHNTYRTHLLGRNVGFLPWLASAKSDNTELLYILPYGVRSNMSLMYQYKALDAGVTTIDAKVYFG